MKPLVAQLLGYSEAPKGDGKLVESVRNRISTFPKNEREFLLKLIEQHDKDPFQGVTGSEAVLDVEDLKTLELAPKGQQPGQAGSAATPGQPPEDAGNAAGAPISASAAIVAPDATPASEVVPPAVVAAAQLEKPVTDLGPSKVVKAITNMIRQPAQSTAPAPVAPQAAAPAPAPPAPSIPPKQVESVNLILETAAKLRRVSANTEVRLREQKQIVESKKVRQAPVVLPSVLAEGGDDDDEPVVPTPVPENELTEGSADPLSLFRSTRKKLRSISSNCA